MNIDPLIAKKVARRIILVRKKLFSLLSNQKVNCRKTIYYKILLTFSKFQCNLNNLNCPPDINH